MKLLNISKFMTTEMGCEIENIIKCWDNALEERMKVTPGFGNQKQGLGFEYWNDTCESCQNKWEAFQLAIKQFYGLEFHFTRTDEYFGICTEDGKTWLMKELR